MRNVFLHIVLVLLLAGCRANKVTKAQDSRVQTDEACTELRRTDSLWSSATARKTIRIEFYEPQDTLLPIAHFSECPFLTVKDFGLPRLSPTITEAGAFGAVKSIEILDEKTECMSAISGMDSVVERKIAESENKSETVDEISGKENNFESMVKSIKMLLIGAILAMWVLLCKINEKKNRK